VTTGGEVRYPPLAAVLEAHDRLLETYGGSGGVRNPGGVEAALARAEQLRAYADEEPSLFALAAAIGYAIVRTHRPFVDGNKRTGFYAAVATLWMNGWRLDVAETAAAEMFERLAAGEVEEPALAAWLGRNSVRLES
jgi:death-on-curing protein